MKVSSALFGLVAVAHTVSAHYIFNTLVYNGQTSAAAVRKPQNNSPVQPVDSPYMACNKDPFPATETVEVAAGSTVGFKLDKPIFHVGPAALYLGKAPDTAASWDGSGQNWFKIAEWGLENGVFADLGKDELTCTIPKETPPGEYLLRAEQIAYHNLPVESYMSCAQIKITGDGTGTPSPKVSIPGYLQPSEADLNVNVYSKPATFKVPGPAVWNGTA